MCDRFIAIRTKIVCRQRAARVSLNDLEISAGVRKAHINKIEASLIARSVCTDSFL